MSGIDPAIAGTSGCPSSRSSASAAVNGSMQASLRNFPAAAYLENKFGSVPTFAIDWWMMCPRSRGRSWVPAA
jgi:hypothetical protein